MRKLNFSKLRYNVIVITIFIVLAYIFTHGLEKMTGTLDQLDQGVSLDYGMLPEYLLRTGMRFLIAIIFSVLVAIIYAYFAAKNLRMRRLLVPLLDVLQSIPVLGYLSFTVTAFINIAPGNILGIELAVIFAVFTAQVWNIIFSVYQSFITIPSTLYEVAKMYRLNKWQIFWKIELPFAVPGLIWNIMLSMTSSWFYIVVQEVITVGTQNYTMPGMGAYIALALKDMDALAIIYATVSMISLILIFNELFFKPLVAWSYKFRYEFNVGEDARRGSWFLDCLQRASVCGIITKPAQKLFDRMLYINLVPVLRQNLRLMSVASEVLFWSLILWALILLYQQLYTLCANHLSIEDVFTTLRFGGITALRIFVMLLCVSAIWIPVGIYIGLNPRLASRIQPVVQFMTALPVHLYYPLFVVTIVHFKLNCDIWLSFMIVIGSQWYILYNVISGTQTIPTEILEVASICKLTVLRKAIQIHLPSIFPSYITGLIAAFGGSWNASIVTEIIHWKNHTLITDGLGSYITINTIAGNFAEIALGVITMSIFVVSINYLVWKPLYQFASTRFCLE